MKIEDVTIIIPVRNEIDLFKLNLSILREYYPNINILCSLDDIGDDDDRYDKFIELSKRYNFKYENSKERKGLVYHVPNLIEKADTPIIVYLHADMVISKYFIENMGKHLGEKIIVSGTRIEPPLHPSQPKVKIIKNCGLYSHDFNKEMFNKTVGILQNQFKDKTTDGVFAPHMFYKNDWINYDPIMSFQSKEDSFLWREMLIKGYNFVQSWDALVYHFTSRGSRFTNKIGQNSEEWKIGNKKNMRNFIRKWKSEPLYSDTQHPILVPQIDVDCFIIPDSNCNIYDTLYSLEPYFQTIYIYGKEDEDNIKQDINKYCEEIDIHKPHNFDRKKIQFIQTNASIDETIEQIKYQMKSNYLCVTSNYAINDQFLNSFRKALASGKKSIGLYHNKKTPSCFIFHKNIEFINNSPVELDDMIDLQIPNRLEYINKYGETPEYRETFIIPVKTKKRQSLGLGIIQKNEEHLVENIIWRYEPYFDEIAILTDGDNYDKMFEFVSNYCEKTQPRVNYDVVSKFKLNAQPLEWDFAKQRNTLSDMLSTEYIMQLDADELFDNSEQLNEIDMIHSMVETIKKENAKCVLFPRKNFIDGEQTSTYPDLQGRLYKKGSIWINKFPYIGATPGCHEQLDCMHESSMVVENVNLLHLKSSKKQNKQNANYKITWKLKDFPDNILYDSVLYTNEGITYHAKKEIEILIRHGYNIKTLEPYRDNDEYSEILKHANAVFPVNTNDYITIINQPPSRWHSSFRYKNIIPYLVFEGQPPKDWVEIMNSGYINRILTPSTMCKNDFIKAGVTTPISVVPHGVDMNIWKPNKQQIKNKPFTILSAGSPNNERKGFDILLRGFCKAFTPKDNVQLILKVNKIYTPNMHVNDYIMKHVDPKMMDKIVYIDYNMKEHEMVELMNHADLFVSTSRSEGFNLFPLQAMACKTPVMVTNGGGHLDYCNTDNSILIPVTDTPYHPKYVYPYIDSTWFNINEDKFYKLLRHTYNNKSTLYKYIDNAYETAKRFSWENTIKVLKEKLTKTEEN